MSPAESRTLHGRVAIITGAATGIGRATALLFARAGARLALADVRDIELGRTVADAQTAGAEVTPVVADLARPADCAAVVGSAVRAFGRLDVLVNNAGITRDALALRMKQEDWDAVLRTNLTGAHLAIQQALGLMLRQHWGRIINVSSAVAQMGNAGQANYVASKAGLIGLTKAIAVEVASRNITVNAVAPGFITSPMTDPLPQKIKDEMLTHIPLGRFGSDAEVAAAIVFLASEEAGYITGHVLDMNGGLYMA